jgi:hypothetical protein
VEIIHTQTLANPTEVAERAVVNVPIIVIKEFANITEVAGHRESIA